jgi:hypothetical protein
MLNVVWKMKKIARESPGKVTEFNLGKNMGTLTEENFWNLDPGGIC